jgi:predicted TIM-barrel fold metal-dependent hydrolase
MDIVDSHHHLWDLTRNHYPLLAGPMHDRGWGDWSPLRRNYLVDDLLADAGKQRLVKSVHVQANVDASDPVKETAWLDAVASDSRSGGFPHGVVAYVNFSWPDVQAWLDRHSAYPRMRGIRQVLNRHADPVLNRADRDFLADEAWRRNLGLLRRYGWSFDAQVYYQQMPSLAELATRYSDIQFILDHAGMPAERTPEALAGWRREMKRLAQCPNVAVKLSGYGMMDLHWSVDSIRPYVLEPVEWFGPHRAMFGSNFPVDRLMASYDRLWDAYRQIVADFTPEEQQALLGTTAERIYRL